MEHLNLSSESGEELPKFKLQIFGQAFLYQKMAIPRKEKQITESGIVCEVENWYNELECKQVAIEHKDLYITKATAEKYVEELGKAILATLAEKNLIVER